MSNLLQLIYNTFNSNNVSVIKNNKIINIHKIKQITIKFRITIIVVHNNNML
jgi:hypothetical protein